MIHIGICTAIYFVIVFIFAMLGLIPIFLPLLTVLVPIFGGIVYMLYLLKAEGKTVLVVTHDSVLIEECADAKIIIKG